MCLGQSPRAESNARRVRGQTPLFLAPAFIRRKADTGPEGGIPQIAPAEHALVTAASTEQSALQRNQRTHGNERLRSRRQRDRRERRGQRCPGHAVITTRRGLPHTAHQTKRPLLRTTPPRPRNAQGHFERRRRRGPGNESTGADPKSTNANTAAAAAPKRTNDGQLPATQPPYQDEPEPQGARRGLGRRSEKALRKSERFVTKPDGLQPPGLHLSASDDASEVICWQPDGREKCPITRSLEHLSNSQLPGTDVVQLF